MMKKTKRFTQSILSIIPSPTPSLSPSINNNNNNNSGDGLYKTISDIWYVFLVPIIGLVFCIILIDYKLREADNDPNSTRSRNRARRELARSRIMWVNRAVERMEQRRMFREMFWNEDGGFVRHEMKKDHIRNNVNIGVINLENNSFDFVNIKAKPSNNSVNNDRNNTIEENDEEKQQNPNKNNIITEEFLHEMIQKSLGNDSNQSQIQKVDISDDMNLECGICICDYEHGDIICKSIHLPESNDDCKDNDNDSIPAVSAMEPVIANASIENSNDENNENTIPIKNTTIKLAPSDICNHVYHLDCITQWLMKKNAKGKCPICRRIFLSMEGLEDQYQGSSRSTRLRWMNRRNNSRQLQMSDRDRIHDIDEEDNDDTHSEGEGIATEHNDNDINSEGESNVDDGDHGGNNR